MFTFYEQNPKRLVVNILDEVANSQPDKVFVKISISLTGYEAGFKKVTYSGLANAVNGLAWWLHENIGFSKDFETLAYIGPNDLGHVVLLLGAIKAGYKVN